MKIKSLLILVICCCAVSMHAQMLYGSRPNIVFIFADDLGYNDLGAYNNPYIQTPHLDELAATGARFTQAYVNAANCAPSRACLMTGMFTPKHRIYTVANSDRGKTENRKLVPVDNVTVLDTSYYTVAEMLSDAGYDSYHVGKWHLGQGSFSPLGQGFSENIGGNMKGSVSSHFTSYKKEIPGLSDQPDSMFLADALTNKAIEIIEKKHNKPFFIYLPFYSVHSPVQAPAPLIDKYRKIIPQDAGYSPVYAAMTENLDGNVGRILEAIKKTGNSGNTLIVFLSDNGPVLTYTKTTLRGEKGSLYEAGIREPLILNWPGHIKAKTVINQPVMAVDFFPTLAALAGANNSKQAKELDGTSLLPLMAGKTLADRPMIWHFPCYLEAYRKNVGPWRETPSSAIRHGKWKLVKHYENGQVELFDLEADEKETTDLAKQYPAVVAKLQNELTEYLQKTNAFIPTELNPNYQSQNN